MNERLLLPSLTVAFLLLGVGWPMLRSWRRYGVFALVVQKARDPLSAFIGRSFGFGIAGIALWSLLFAALGPKPLDVWELGELPTAVGLGVAVAGLLLVLVAQAQMGASWRIGIDDVPTGLIEDGVYRWVRHPIYTGLFAMLLGVVGLTPSPWTLTGAGWVATMIAVQARLEDRSLDGAHGAAWRAWARRTGRLLPGIGTLDQPEGA